MIRVLSEENARQLLRQHHFGRLACVVNGDPYIVPINYKFEDDSIYCHSLPGMKIEGLRSNPRACVQVDDIKSSLFWTSVLAVGNYEEVIDAKERDLIRSGILKEFPMLTPVESAVTGSEDLSEIIVFRIRVDRITGIAEGVTSDEALLIKNSSRGYFAAR